jgi:hypothetical protein
VASAVESNQSMNAVEHKQAAATPKCELMEVDMVNTGKSTSVPDKLGNLLCQNLSAMSRQKVNCYSHYICWGFYGVFLKMYHVLTINVTTKLLTIIGQ